MEQLDDIMDELFMSDLDTGTFLRINKLYMKFMEDVKDFEEYLSDETDSEEE